MTHSFGEYPETTMLTGVSDTNHEPNRDYTRIETIHGTNMTFNLLQDVSKKVATVSRLSRLVEQVTKMTQHALNASASSILLVDDKERELLFEVAAGPVGKTLRQVRVSARSGIAGWVAYQGRPLIVNDVSKDRRFNNSLDEITGFVTKSMICTPLVIHRKIIGVIEVLNKLDGSDFNEQDMEALISVASIAAMSIENTRLHQAALDTYKSTIKALAAAIDAKDSYTCGHSQRVMEYALMTGNFLSFSEDTLTILEYAGILHDVGKIGVADSILTNPGSLTAEEWNIMRQHSTIGSNILNGITFLEKSRILISHHHERYDGKGYPDGLMGEAIPIGARLLAVADAFDSMTTARSYRPAPGVDYAVSELHNCCGTQFCPVAVNAFVSAYNSKNDKIAYEFP